VDDGGSSPRRGWEFFSSSPRPDRLWGPPSLPSNGYRGSFPSVKRPVREADRSPPSSAEVKEFVELYLHSSTPSRRGAQLKHWDSFTFALQCIRPRFVRMLLSHLFIGLPYVCMNILMRLNFPGYPFISKQLIC
jgi:hypothetical protein